MERVNVLGKDLYRCSACGKEEAEDAIRCPRCGAGDRPDMVAILEQQERSDKLR